MPEMQKKVVITCAVTGSLTTPEMTPYLPITPEHIADACLGAAEAGAAVTHIHVRDPKTGRPSMELDYYHEVLERIRTKNANLILNVTTGPGGRFQPGDVDPIIAGPRTNLLRAEKRVAHIVALKPDIGTLDLNTMTFGSEAVINTPQSVRKMAIAMRGAGVKPEIELFDSGDIALLHDVIKTGEIAMPAICSIVLGVKYGFQPSPETVLYARDRLPPGMAFTAFGIGRSAFPMVAQSVLAGGHARIGLEDAVYMAKDILAKSNAEMVERTRKIVELLGAQIATPKDAREIFGLPTRPV
jgi:3-dehydrocarnitine:acetyl-CoA trimethylamine transferase